MTINIPESRNSDEEKVEALALSVEEATALSTVLLPPLVRTFMSIRHDVIISVARDTEKDTITKGINQSGNGAPLNMIIFSPSIMLNKPSPVTLC